MAICFRWKVTNFWDLQSHENLLKLFLLQATSYYGKILSHLMTKPTKWLCIQRRLWSDWADPPSLIRVFAVCSIGSSGPKLSSCGQQRLWSDWVDPQADLSLRWAPMPFCWFCHEAAQIIYRKYLKNSDAAKLAVMILKFEHLSNMILFSIE